MASLSGLERELSIPSNAFLPPSGAAKLSTPVSSISLSCETSIHSSTKCLLIGRQASTADVRIDHKSISRKHAALYFIPDEKSGGAKLILRDLGGKYGCTINGNGAKVATKTEVSLENGDRIQFGNVREQIFMVQFDGKKMHVRTSQEREEFNDEKACGILAPGDANRNGNGSDSDENENEKSDKPTLTGRAAREAEIAAMMASLDEAPAYSKYTQNNGNSISNKQIDMPKEQQPQSQQQQQTLPPIAAKLKIPITSQITLTGPSTPSLPTSISLDPSGSRIVVGSSDTSIRLYDFNGMDLSAKPFKIVTVQEGHSIVQNTFSNTGDRIIVGTTSAQPMILDRDGNEIIEFNKGDMYVTDMAHTDGHVANITGVDWHPLERDIVITSSLDGSVRLWDVERNKTKFQKLCCKKEQVYRIKSSFGKRTVVTCVVMAPGGREFACGTSCGSIQIWSTLKVGSRPARVIYNAHEGGIAIHSLVYSADGKKLASRCMDDDRVFVWDARRISRTATPVAICGGLLALHEYVNCAFSPDGKLICAGTSVDPRAKNITSSSSAFGMLKFYSTDATATVQEPILEVDMVKGLSAVNVVWHNKLNQIIVGLSDGSLRIFYDSKYSTKGAKLPVSKGLRQTDDLTLLLNSRAPQGIAGMASMGEIRTPHSLPLFRDAAVETKNTKRKREKDRQDPIKSKRPDLPGTGIKVSEGTSASMNFQQTVLTSAIAKNKNIAGKDPREELFKYSAEEKYTIGDGKRVLADKTVEEEEEEQ